MPAVSSTLNCKALAPPRRVVFQATVVPLTLPVMSLQVAPPSVEPYRRSPDSEADSVADTVCAAVLVRKSVVLAPLSADRAMLPMVVVGALMSIRMDSALDALPILPATSVNLAVRPWTPSAREAVVMSLKPLAMSSAVSTALPTWVVLSYSLTVSPATAAVPSVALVPKRTRTTGVVTLVVSSLFRRPESEAARRSGASVGAAGAILSRATDWALEIPEKLLAPPMFAAAVETSPALMLVASPSRPLAPSVRLTAPLPTAVTRLEITWFAASVPVEPAAGAEAASMATVAIWAAAF